MLRTHYHMVNSKLGDHSFLSENTVDGVRKLAGTFIEGVESRLGIKIGPDHALWTWALNRFQGNSLRTCLWQDLQRTSGRIW